MKLPRRQFLHLAAGAAALPAVSRIARAQTYPTRSITVIVPFPAAGIEHIAGILLQKQTGTRFQQVPYRGLAPAMQDLVAGQIDILLADATTALAHVEAGRIKAYAVAAKTRLAAAPNIPTVDQAG